MIDQTQMTAKISKRGFIAALLTSVAVAGLFSNSVAVQSCRLVNNSKLLKEIRISKLIGILTPALRVMIREIVERTGDQPQWKSSDRKDVLIGYALYHSERHILSFQDERSQNPFAYLVVMITGSFCVVRARYSKEARLILSKDPADLPRLNSVRKSIIALEENSRVALV